MYIHIILKPHIVRFNREVTSMGGGKPEVMQACENILLPVIIKFINIIILISKDMCYYDFYIYILKAFQELVQELGGILPMPTYVKGHRWGAAFPSELPSLVESLGAKYCADVDGGRAYVNTDSRFAACGDYFIEVGSIEGATLSAISCANKIIASDTLNL